MLLEIIGACSNVDPVWGYLWGPYNKTYPSEFVNQTYFEGVDIYKKENTSFRSTNEMYTKSPPEPGLWSKFAYFQKFHF
jgi:hypothetical protein